MDKKVFELITNLRMDLEARNAHEDDAYHYENQARELAFEDGELDEEEYERLERAAEEEQESAHQLKHVIECDFRELEELLGYSVTEDDILEGILENKLRNG